MNECVLCGHAGVDHRHDGCQGRSPFFGACKCSWVAQEPLAVDAGAAEHLSLIHI